MTSTNSTIDSPSFGKTEIRLARAFLALLLLAGAAQIVFEHSHDSISLLPCPFHSLTGIQCPGCGMTRACLATGRGDVAAAWHYHPFVFILVSAALPLALAPEATARLLARHSQRSRNTIAFILLAALFLFWLFRLAVGWNV